MAPKPQDETNAGKPRHSAQAIANIDDVGDSLAVACKRLGDLIDRLVT